MGGFKDFIRHAFAVESETYEDLSDEDKQLIERLAKGIVTRGLAVPSVMFLESIKPLNFIGSQVMVFFRPIVAAIFPTSLYDRFEKLLEKRQSIEWLLISIEKHSGKGREKRK